MLKCPTNLSGCAIEFSLKMGKLLRKVRITSLRNFIFKWRSLLGNADVSILKELIGKAKKTCILCDPYFSREDFLEYGIVVSSTDIVLHVVTSEAFLLQPLSEDNPIKQGKLLMDLLEQCSDHAFFRFNVLKGRKRSPLHDRFMVLDDDVYLLGSSFYGFGSRATTLYKIPNPDSMKHVAERWIKNEDLSLSFEEWVEEFKELKE